MVATMNASVPTARIVAAFSEQPSIQIPPVAYPSPQVASGAFSYGGTLTITSSASGPQSTIRYANPFAPQSIPAIGSLIVTPDFEIVLFPTGDDAELVHELDRFAVRERQGETLHFRLNEKSVQRALSEGMYLSRILATLRGQSRTPVPQNVLSLLR